MDKGKLGFTVKVLVVLFLVSWLASSFFSFSLPKRSIGNVALIPVKGLILVDGDSTVFGEEIASSSKITEFIKEADQDPSIKAIIFDINSPGGSAVASKEISDAIKKTDKLTIAVIREVGASGGVSSAVSGLPPACGRTR